MAYQRLRISPNAPERVRDHIERFELAAWFQEAHWLLSNRIEPKAGGYDRPFTYVTAVFLLAITGGISSVFYDHASKKSGERFKALLAKYYPWDLEPPGGADATTGPHLLYKAFRNPLAHELGMLDKTIGGFGTVALSFPEDELEVLERSLSRPALADRTLTIDANGGPTLNIPGLYWGLRLMVYRLTDDTAMMLTILPKLR